MANWRSAGHAIRRRQGAHSSHMDSAGIGGRVNLPTPEEALAGMARVGSPRVPMGTSAITAFAKAPAIPPLRGTMVPKGNAKSADPALGPTSRRGNVPQERLGAAHMVTFMTPPMIDPAAGATQANGRIIPSSITREDSFVDAVSGAYAGY